MDKIIDKIMIKCDNTEDTQELWDMIGKYHSDNKETAHNLIAGIPVKGDKVLFYQLFNGDLKVFGYREKVVSYPPKEAKHVRKAIITGIAVIDVKNDWYGGEASILAGGIGSGSVDIKFESEFYRGFAFCLIIFGKYVRL